MDLYFFLGIYTYVSSCSKFDKVDSLTFKPETGNLLRVLLAAIIGILWPIALPLYMLHAHFARRKLARQDDQTKPRQSDDTNTEKE